MSKLNETIDKDYCGDNATYTFDKKTGLLRIDGNGAINANTFYESNFYSHITKVVIGKGITSIGDYAFYKCSGLTSITIPNSVTSIGYEAFYKCSGLKSVTIPNSVTSIGYEAFYKCSGLKSVTFAKNSQLTSIGDDAFRDCSSLTSVNIPNSVTSIGWSAFAYCSGLTSNKIHDLAENNNIIAYKAFVFTNDKLQCKGFIYEEGKSYKEKNAILCESGFHACLNPLDVFNYYKYTEGKTEIHEVILTGDIDAENDDDTKVCATEITIGRKLTLEDISNIFNHLEVK